MAEPRNTTQQVIEPAIHLVVIALILYSCFQIFQPFLLPVAWAIIIAVAIYPLYVRLVVALGGRTRLGLVVLGLIGVGLLLIPTAMLTGSLIDEVQAAHQAYETGQIQVPPPPARVAEVPVIGERLYASWSSASSNLHATLERHQAEILKFLGSMLGAVAGVGMTVLQFVVSILIALVLIANADAGRDLARAICRRLAGEGGAEFADLATATTRSVAQGVLGVALIQSILAGMGMLAVGVPAAGVLALMVLVLAVMQLPPLVILLPVAIFVFTASATVPAVLFAIWAILVSMSDAFLKPLLLGRGLDIPMLVILVGAIGGMIEAGVIGLFVGAVVLALAYRLFVAWLGEAPAAATGS